MVIDGNDLEKKSLEKLKAGNVADSRAAEDEFLRQAREQPDGGCSCPKNDCRWHGKCYECVMLHRGAADHIPTCFHDIVNKRLQGALDLTESIAQKR